MVRKVIVTGIPGVGKTTVLNELKDLAEEAKLRLTVINYGTVMNEILKELGKEIHRDEMRRQDIELQKKLQDLAANEILNRAAGSIVIVDTHMFIRTGGGLWSGLPYNVLARLKPSLIVLIEAPPADIAERRASDKSRIRDSALINEIEFDLSWSRSTASACAVLTGAPVRIIRNDYGKQREAARELLQTIRELM